MSNNPKCLSFFASSNGAMDNEEYTKQALKLIGHRYDFCGKVGITFLDTPNGSVLLGTVHNFGDDVPECDFCIWLTGFTEAVGADREAAEAKLAEVSYRCGTLFFSAPGSGKPANEMVLRRTRYEHALDIGSVDGHSVFMCW